MNKNVCSIENEARRSAQTGIEMILTVTLNPAVDKTYETEELIKGQVNRMRSVRSIAGGKGINVARVLLRFGKAVCTAGFLGGYTGRFIEDTVRGLGAECYFTGIAGNTRTSMNILADTGYVTELLEPGPVVTGEELHRFREDFRNILGKCELVALCGSAPASVPVDIYRELIEICHEAGKRVFLDTSGELLREGVKAKPYMIKPNLRELEYLTGRRIRTLEEIRDTACSLVEGGIKKVAVSLGKHGMYYAGETGTLYLPAPDVLAVNTVACGDCAVASFLMSESEGVDEQEAVHRAVCLSAANAVTLENADIPVEKYHEFLKALDSVQ